MIKPKASWWVPLSSFAIAILLAIVSGPKSRMTLRAEDAPTAAVPACVCDLKNFTGDLLYKKPKWSGELDFNYIGGVTGHETISNLKYEAWLRFEIIVKVKGVDTTIPLEVEMICAPPGKFITAQGIVTTNAIKFNAHVVDQKVDAAFRGARNRYGANFVGEAPGTRTFPQMRFKLTAKVADPSSDGCKDELNTRATMVVTGDNGIGGASQND